MTTAELKGSVFVFGACYICMYNNGQFVAASRTGTGTDHQMPLDWGSCFLESESKKLPLAFNLQHDKSRKRAACMNMLGGSTDRHFGPG